MVRRISSIVLLIIAISSYTIAQETPLSGEFGPGATIPINNNRYVPTGQSLIIYYGSTVQFNGPFHIRVEGNATLTATGTEEQPVLFTSPPGNPTPGYWHALIADGTLLNHAVMTLTNCEIRYGGEHEADPRFASGVIRCLHPCEVVITDCFIHDNWGEGVGTDHGGANENHLELTDCRIENCEIGVKLVLPDANTVVKRNWIESCVLGMRLHTDPNLPSEPIVANNIIKNCQGNGVEDLITFNSLLAHFKNNVIDGSGSSGMYFTSNIVADVVQNNIFVNNSRYGIEVLNTRSGVVSYNCFNNNTIDDYTGNVRSYPEVTANPELTEAFGDENYYHLQWDSPCLGQGIGTNSNPATSTADIGAYGGPELEEGPPFEEGRYWVCITDEDVYSTPEHPSLNQDASPFHVLGYLTFDVPPDHHLLITAQGAPCELYFDGDAPTLIGAYGDLTVAGSGENERVIFGLLESSVNNWWGIRVGSTGSVTTNQIGYADISGADNGIIASNCKLWVDHCNIHDCGNTGVTAEYMQLGLSYSTISNNGTSGLFIWPEAQVMAVRNTLSFNGFSGVAAMSFSKFIADHNFDIIPVNYIFGNGHDQPGSYHQVDLYDHSGALMKEGHNQITNDQYPLVWSHDNCPIGPNPVQYNWWGVPDPPPSYFEPPECWLYLPCDETAWGQGEGGRSAAELAFADAVALEESGDYLAAEAAYRYVVANYTTDPLASEALNRTFYCTREGNGNFNSQVAYYQDISDTCSDATIAKHASELNWRSLVELAEFQEALDRCEAVIANPPSLADSVLAVMDAGFTYLAAEAHGGGLASSAPFGMYPSLRPVSYENYLQRSEELLALLQTSEGITMKTGSSSVPVGFTLDKPYPNPFNASTIISYSLLDTRDVNLAVYDILGRQVTTLVNGRQDAGDHQVIWSGESSTGIPVSSGIYFVRMSTETGVQSAKMLLLK